MHAKDLALSIRGVNGDPIAADGTVNAVASPRAGKADRLWELRTNQLWAMRFAPPESLAQF
jgi:hypothetical protein